MIEQSTAPDDDDDVNQQKNTWTKRAWWRRPGCLIGLGIWFAIVIFVFFVIILLARDEITISQGNAPNQQIRVWLISEPDQRGIGFSRTSLQKGNPDEVLCVQTHVNFIMWQGDGNNSIDYCECYAENENSDALRLTRAESGVCTPNR
ncbi:MAG: hypothetical protein D6737_04390 [Chloroflexi bacterium]|nr:MAG: hypothetical protein CUN54_07470 [Phototrophicales bacterium]RMF81635.1 MAG: hypothetical protein D6737_04390 [Chloroflexota bacterium]